MDIANLVHMANRIGDFYASFPDREEALREIAGHVHRFWAPRMRREILSQLNQATTAELHPMVREALDRWQAELAPGP